MKTLHQIAKECATDKAEWGHNYTIMYAMWMDPQRETTKSLLEIGYGLGGSARMWLEYFPNAEVYIVENFSETPKNLWFEHPRLHLVESHQANFELWKQVPDNLDWVIDDGSHRPEDVVASAMAGFYKLKRGGLWFVEDTHCNFHSNYTDKDILYSQWLYPMVMRQQISPNHGGDFYKMYQLLTDDDLAKYVYAYHLYRSIIALEKG